MKLYRLDIQVAATAYIAADSEARAKILAQESLVDVGYFLTPDGEFIVSDRFENMVQAGERVTLSPVITVYGPRGVLADMKQVFPKN